MPSSSARVEPLPQPPAVETRALVKRYGKACALAGLDLAVPPGQLYGFLGPNGAGKTTTIRILTGVTRPTSGSAHVSGVDVLRNPVLAKTSIGVVSQHVNLDADLTVFENLELHGILHGLSKSVRRGRIEELLAFAGMKDRARSLSRTLSGGLKRRVTILRALLHEPELLFLDEPTAGLDPSSRRLLWDLVRSIHRNGVTIFLTTHYIEEAEFLCQRVGILHEGRLVAEGEPRRMLEELGEYAVELPAPEGTRTDFRRSREEALSLLATAGEGAAIRRANLEDLFLRLTGRRVAP